MNTKNMKKFASTLFALALGLGVVSGINYVYAVGGKPVGFSFPNCPLTEPGCYTPISISNVDQIKPAGLSVDAFVGALGARFKQSVQFDQLAGVGDRTTCVDASGKIKVCGTQYYTEASDLIAFSVKYNGGSSWTLTSAKVIMSTDPTHIGNASLLQLAGATKPSTGHYELDVTYNNGGYHINTSEIISAVLTNSGTVKLNMSDASGSNRVEFITSNDASADDLTVGDQVKFLFAFPPVI